jgi:VWFA-related protein
MVLKPNFLLKLSARMISATHPSRGFAASYWTAITRGPFPAGHLSQRKVYMHSMHKLLMQCVATTVAAILALPAMPQEPAVQGGTIKSRVNLVNLFATVRDKNKRIVPTLKQEDFRISEDNQDQKIAFFSREVALPITLALLLDTSGSEQDMLSAIQNAGSQFISRIIRKGDEALVMSFDSDVDLLSDFTDERSQLERAIRRSRINVPDQGSRGGNPGPIGSRQVTGTALYDAIYLACGEKLATEAGRKAIVIVTDAQDEGSKVRLEEAIEAAQRTDTVIHILLVVDPRYGGNPGVAHKLAEDTGGRMISVRSEKKLMEAFDEISEELRSQYTLGYYPTNAAQDGKFRKLKVETTDHEMKVLARKGYYAPKG